MKLRDRKVTIMGLGRHGGGVAAAKYCAQVGAQVTITDLATERELAGSIAESSKVPISKWTLGKHDLDDFRAAEIVVVNPAVKPGNEFVAVAIQCGARITSEIELFLNACPAMVIGVTGTVGKSTTAAILAAILGATGRPTWLGGNIGRSLLVDLDRIAPSDFVVLELSSFQLHWLGETARWPKAAIVTNCSPNHLEWHGAWEHYVASKQRLLRNLPAGGVAIINHCDPEVSSWRGICKGKLHPAKSIESISQLRIPGEHNRLNAACAAAMATAFGANDETISTALQQFSGLPHRLAFVAEVGERKFYNDSKSTSHAATIAALHTMHLPSWLLLGGAARPAESAQELNRFLTAVSHHAQGAALFGASAGKLHQRWQELNPGFPVYRTENLEQAFQWIWDCSHPGEAILLSPGYPSTDQFRDFVHRGEEFEQLVQRFARELQPNSKP